MTERDFLSSAAGGHAEPFKADDPLKMAPVIEDKPLPEGLTLFQVGELYGVSAEEAAAICKTRGYKPVYNSNASRFDNIPDGLTYAEIAHITGLSLDYVQHRAKKKYGIKVAKTPVVNRSLLYPIIQSLPPGLTKAQIQERTGWSKSKVIYACWYWGYQIKRPVRKYDWSVINFAHSNKEIARMLGTSQSYVCFMRGKIAPEARARFPKKRRRWRRVDFRRSNYQIAKRLGVSKDWVSVARSKYAPETRKRIASKRQ